jgi:hypothetical protein
MARLGSAWKQVMLVGTLALALASCGGEPSPDTAASPTSTETTAPDTEALENRIAELEAEAADEEAKARKAARDKKKRRARARREREARETASAAAPEPSSGGGIVVPDVTGLDHQAAQDALQGEGLWLLDEEDATGQGRALLFDRNWEVVRTDPPAGSSVSEDTTITLYSKKQGE